MPDDLVERVTRALDTWVDPEKVRDAIDVVLEEAADAIGEVGDHAAVGAYIDAIRALKETP